METKQKLSALTVILHWLVAVLIIGLAAVGLYMANTETWFLYPYHKSIGVIAFIAVMLRVIWRVKNGWPEPASQYQHYEHVMAKLVHWVLIVATVLMPVSGMVLSGASGHGFGIFALQIVPMNHSPLNPDEAIPFSEFWTNAGYFVHEYLGYVLIAAIVLHIAGALKHHMVDRDSTLKRMLGHRI